LGRGTVVTGRIERGKIKVGEEVEIVGFRETRKAVVTGVEMFMKQLDEGRAGDNAGLLLLGIGKEEVERGMVLAKPGSITTTVCVLQMVVGYKSPRRSMVLPRRLREPFWTSESANHRIGPSKPSISPCSMSLAHCGGKIWSASR
jgi:hypothetical protein